MLNQNAYQEVDGVEWYFKVVLRRKSIQLQYSFNNEKSQANDFRII